MGRGSNERERAAWGGRGAGGGEGGMIRGKGKGGKGMRNARKIIRA